MKIYITIIVVAVIAVIIFAKFFSSGFCFFLS